ncbi:MAG TPA: tyrosine-type recombinase/integrase [Amnibacterium sp.]|uniref:tyrosine-type recombinase/integrase n=1 Tax=Amnibacterium sp. TaxID=1872496 RepID=UPI002F95F595
MGSVEPYATDQGRRYRVRYRDPERRTKAKAGFRTRRDAEAFLAEVSVAVKHGDYVDPGAGRRTVGVLGPQWLATLNHLKPSSFAPLEAAWRVYVAPRWGATEIGRIRPSEVQAWIADLIAGSAPSTTTPRPLGPTSVKRAHGVLASILDVAVRDRLLQSNPARGVSLPRKVPRRHQYLSHQQVELLASETRTKGSLVRFLCYTGLRWGEATALRVRDVDLERRRLRVIENAVRVNGRILVGTPKTHHTRTVPIPPFLCAGIAALVDGQPESALVFSSNGAYLQQPTAKGGWYVSAVKRAQAADPTFPRPTIHDLRHTAASLAVSAGANVKAVQRMLGHASAAMTLDVYTDLFEEDLDRVSLALDEARAASLAQFLRSFPADQGPEESEKPGNMRV